MQFYFFKQNKMEATWLIANIAPKTRIDKGHIPCARTVFRLSAVITFIQGFGEGQSTSKNTSKNSS